MAYEGMTVSGWKRLFSPGCAALPRLSALADAVLRQAEDLAAAAAAIGACFGLETAKGAQLDLLGASLNLYRAETAPGAADAAFREAIRSRLALRRWDGTCGSLRPLLEAAGMQGPYEDHMDMTVSAPAGAPVPAGIQLVPNSSR